jgi:hypothetical protein
MRGRRLIFIPVLAIFLVIGIAFSANALDFDSYDNTWHKSKFKIKAVCEDQGDFALSKESAKENGWIYIDDADAGNFDGSLVTQDEDGDWQENPITLNVIGGTADDMLLELAAPVSVTDGFTGDVVTVNALQVRLKGKENRDAELKSSKLTGVSGQATLDVEDSDFFCYSSLGLSGKYRKKGPPEDVTDDTGLPPAP